KKLDQIPNRTRAFSEIKAPVIGGVDFEKRLVKAPVDLDRLFTKHTEAKEFFSSLSFTNQKEYVSWIEGAKKEETRARRVE
ncbi:YdeI/OmpD-associated family protein, partial [Vibrio parahaemolyticus]